MTTKNSIKISYNDLFIIKSVLAVIKLEAQESSARRRFIRSVNLHIQDADEEAKDIRDRLCIKDKDQKPVFLDKRYQYTKENGKKAREEIKKLNDQEVVISKDESNTRDIATVKKILSKEVTRVDKEAAGEYTAESFDKIETLKEVIAKL